MTTNSDKIFAQAKWLATLKSLKHKMTREEKQNYIKSLMLNPQWIIAQINKINKHYHYYED